MLSDYDLAFDVPSNKKKAWLAFKLDQQETAKTLLDIDWICLSETSSKIQQGILTEGILIYEKNPS